LACALYALRELRCAVGATGLGSAVGSSLRPAGLGALCRRDLCRRDLCLWIWSRFELDRSLVFLDAVEETGRDVDELQRADGRASDYGVGRGRRRALRDRRSGDGDL